MASNAKSKSSKPVRSDAKLSNAELLRLAGKNKPPQAWYDEASNPFKAKPKR